MGDNSLTGKNASKALQEYLLLCSKRTATLQVNQNVQRPHHEDLRTACLTGLRQM